MRCIRLLLLTGLLTQAASLADQQREWSLPTDKINASFWDLADGTITLERDGKLQKLPISDLSLADFAYVAKTHVPPEQLQPLALTGDGRAIAHDLETVRGRAIRVIDKDKTVILDTGSRSIAVKCDTTSYVDGDEIALLARRNGAYLFESELGTTSKLALFTSMAQLGYQALTKQNLHQVRDFSSIAKTLAADSQTKRDHMRQMAQLEESRRSLEQQAAHAELYLRSAKQQFQRYSDKLASAQDSLKRTEASIAATGKTDHQVAKKRRASILSALPSLESAVDRERKNRDRLQAIYDDTQQELNTTRSKLDVETNRFSH